MPTSTTSSDPVSERGTGVFVPRTQSTRAERKAIISTNQAIRSFVGANGAKASSGANSQQQLYSRPESSNSGTNSSRPALVPPPPPAVAHSDQNQTPVIRTAVPPLGQYVLPNLTPVSSPNAAYSEAVSYSSQPFFYSGDGTTAPEVGSWPLKMSGNRYNSTSSMDQHSSSSSHHASTTASAARALHQHCPDKRAGVASSTANAALYSRSSSSDNTSSRPVQVPMSASMPGHTLQLLLSPGSAAQAVDQQLQLPPSAAASFGPANATGHQYNSMCRYASGPMQTLAVQHRAVPSSSTCATTAAKTDAQHNWLAGKLQDSLVPVVQPSDSTPLVPGWSKFTAQTGSSSCRSNSVMACAAAAAGMRQQEPARRTSVLVLPADASVHDQQGLHDQQLLVQQPGRGDGSRSATAPPLGLGDETNRAVLGWQDMSAIEEIDAQLAQLMQMRNSILARKAPQRHPAASSRMYDAVPAPGRASTTAAATASLQPVANPLAYQPDAVPIPASGTTATAIPFEQLPGLAGSLGDKSNYLLMQHQLSLDSAVSVDSMQMMRGGPQSGMLLGQHSANVDACLAMHDLAAQSSGCSLDQYQQQQQRLFYGTGSFAGTSDHHLSGSLINSAPATLQQLQLPAATAAAAVAAMTDLPAVPQFSHIMSSSSDAMATFPDARMVQFAAIQNMQQQLTDQANNLLSAPSMPGDKGVRKSAAAAKLLQLSEIQHLQRHMQEELLQLLK